MNTHHIITNDAESETRFTADDDGRDVAVIVDDVNELASPVQNLIKGLEAIADMVWAEKSDGSPVLAFPVAKSLLWKIWAGASSDASFWADIAQEELDHINYCQELLTCGDALGDEDLKKLTFAMEGRPRAVANAELASMFRHEAAEAHKRVTGQYPTVSPKGTKSRSGPVRAVDIEAYKKAHGLGDPTPRQEAVLIKKADKAAVDRALDAVEAQRPESNV